MSSLDFLKPFTGMLPEVKPPQFMPSLQERLMWTVIALVAFFVMYNTIAVGVLFKSGSTDFLQVVTASMPGSLITTGIGPIVLASIFLQLFVGAKIIDMNLQDPEQRATFHGVQKLLGIVLSFVEAALFVIFSRVSVVDPPLFGSIAATQAIVILQIALGSIILLYLDEIISKYGIGSGISLFIAAGVSFSVMGGAWDLFTSSSGTIAALTAGGADAIPNALMSLMPLFFTFVVFLSVVYAEGIKVEIPLAFEKARGLGGRFPIKFLYVSNIPVILASALLLNVQFMAAALADKSQGVATGAILGIKELGVVSNGQVIDGLTYLIMPIYRSLGGGNFLAHIENVFFATTPIFGIPGWVHVITYMVFLMVICVVFGWFWVETTGMGPHEVAEQLQSSGLQIPGFRRDPRVVEKVLEKYIPAIVVLGSAFVGILSGVADMTGALGTGTGILLTVGILYKLYEELEARRTFDLYPQLAGMLG
ncbi:MAG: preprotein translocase subunit SecY [Candidatus Micrarchaeia archaeon]